jgi:hypothetical protein
MAFDISLTSKPFQATNTLAYSTEASVTKKIDSTDMRSVNILMISIIRLTSKPLELTNTQAYSTDASVTKMREV